jgi:stearoyl-CoA desaturase (delta-9 desaturase)
MELAKKVEKTSSNNYFQNFLMILIHCFALYSVFTWNNYSPYGLLTLAYLFRLFFVAAGNHRYFSHKSFYLNRFFQFIFGIGSTLAMHNSIFWWASKHRLHHKFTDQELDPHSSKKGFYWSHIGWVIHDNNVINEDSIKDLTKYKELVFLNTYHRQINFAFVALILVFLGVQFFFAVYCFSLVLSWSTMFAINSLGHKVGYKNFKTKDNSTNIFAFSFLSLGEGLHNNHHAQPFNPNNRVRWFEIDITFIILYLLSIVGIVNLKKRKT